MEGGPWWEVRGEPGLLAASYLRLAVAVVEGRSRVIVSSDHGPHGEPHAPVLEHDVGEDLGGGADSDPPLVVQLVQAALHAQVSLPILHRSRQFAGLGGLKGRAGVRLPETGLTWQSAAPPAMVPRRKGLISMTFLTVWEEM